MRTGIGSKLERFASEPRGQIILVAFVLALSLVVRLLVAWRTHGCDIDQGCFSYWFNYAATHGPGGFANAVLDDRFFCDYPLANVYIFWLFGKLANALGPDSMPFITKLPGILFDIATALLIFSFLRPRFSFRVALGVMALYTFTVATFFETAVWGQMGSVYTFFMVATLYSALRSNYALSGALFSLAILTKPQSVVLLPVLAYIILRNGGLKRAITSSAAFAAVIVILLLPLDAASRLPFIIESYSGYNVYEYTSVNAYNLWALAGFWENDTVVHLGLTYQQWGILFFVVFAAFVMWQLHRRYDARSAIFAVFLLTFGFFMLMTRMHERYLFSVFALLALGWYTRFTIWIYLGLTATVFAQLAYALSLLNSEAYWIADGHWSVYVLVPANAILFILSIWTFWRMQHQRLPRAAPISPPPQLLPYETAEQPPPLEPPGGAVEAGPRPFGGLKPWSPQVLVALLTILFFTLSVWNLGDLRFPSSDFRPQDHPEEVVLDLGEMTRVDKVFWLRQDAGSTELEVYSGAPEVWELHKEFSDSGDWRRWDSADIRVDTRYVRLVFTGGTGSIGEVAVFAGDEKLAVVGIEGDRPEAIAALIDEQELIGEPDSHKSGTYFDEIYYVRAAEEHLSLQNPYGERTHPPMSKIIIATSIWALGDNPFAWRFAGVVFATLMIPLIYFFARRMFNSERAGVIAAFLLTFDVMHFAEARIATPETFILFFVMAMFYFFYRYWQDPEHRGSDLFVSLLFFGLGFATKWVVMWGFVGLVVLLLILKWRQPIRRSEAYWFVGGIAAAALIYLLSYIPYFLAGFSLGDVYQHHLDMFSFHSSLEATHGWSSEWYTWPIMWRPLWMYVGHFASTTSHISTFGNPALWWFAIPAMLGVLWLAVRQRKRMLVLVPVLLGLPFLTNWLIETYAHPEKFWWVSVPILIGALWLAFKNGRGAAVFIIVPFLAQWLIFAFIGRCLFIYHYYPNVVFLVLAVTLWAKWLWDRYGWGKWVVGAYLLLNIVTFALLFPVFSGYPMSSGYWDTLRWMVNWAT